jgi:hypothetical protein
MVPLWMLPQALVGGNAFILKPSERVPLATLRLAEMLVEAGLPAGVFNMVQGGRDVVEAIWLRRRSAPTSAVIACAALDFAALTATQIAAITTNNILALTTSETRALTTNQIFNGLSTDQVVAFTTAQIATLTSPQFRLGLSSNDLAALSTSQTIAITTSNIAALTSAQLASITTTDVATLTTTQIAALSSNQVSLGFTTDQIQARPGEQARHGIQVGAKCFTADPGCFKGDGAPATEGEHPQPIREDLGPVRGLTEHQPYALDPRGHVELVVVLERGADEHVLHAERPQGLA